MTSFYEDQKQWLNEYSAKDLSRTLVREYLYQHSMFKTLNCFENEDKQNSKKIVKSTVVKMLCINNLVVNNKNLDKEKQCKSLLILLAQYLRGKFEERILRQERSDCLSQDQKPAKQFSMNGDKLLGMNKEENRIKEKNLVDTKRKQNPNEKTLSQEAFYKKKDNSKNQQPTTTLSKKNSNNMTVEQQQRKKSTSNRPSTAKPTLGQKNQEKKEENKVKDIYSKLNNINANDNIIDEDPMAVDIKGLGQRDAKIESRLPQQQKARQISSRNTNSAIGRQSTNVISRTGDSNQNVRNEKIQTNQDVPKQKRYQKETQNTKWNTEISEPKYEQFHSEKLDKKKDGIEDYYDQFQEEPQQPEIKKSTKVIESPVETSKKVEAKVESPPKPKIEEKKQVKSQSMKPQPVKQPEYKFQQLPAKNEPKKIGFEQKAIKQKPQIQEIKLKNQVEAPQQPSKNTGTRMGLKSLKRTTQPITKEQDATKMIGNNVKLLPDDIQPTNNDLPLTNKMFSVNKPQRKIQNSELKIENKKENTTLGAPIKIPQAKKEEQKIEPVPQTNVRQIKLKKKMKPSQEQTVQATKFKFDQNFVDEPLNGPKQKYDYEKFAFNKMTIKPELKPKNSNIVLQKKINYSQKPIVESSNPYAQKKKNEKPLTAQKQQDLRKIMFQKGNSSLPKAWHQGFILSPFGDTFYGLKQIQGGPCGIIAALQCFFLKHMIYLSKPTSESDLKNEIRRESCLIAALTDILWKAKGPNNEKITLVIPANRNFSGPKLEFSSLIEVEIQAPTFESAYETIWNYKSSFIGQANHGVLVIIYSVVMTKGIQKIYQEVDMKENPLIGHHGHCTQELVNLFITGQASSNCFDGKKQLEDNFTLHGIDQKSQFGFLTVFETLEYIEVGKNLKNPIFPIWVISKEFHYHVIFGNHYLISENNDCAKFDLIYFDGLYACDKFIRLTFDEVEKDEFGMVKEQGKIKDLPLIEQVLLKKWGRRKVDWNGSTKIL